MSSALAITIDVDGEAGLPAGGRGWEHRLSSRSERVYGITCGLPRLLHALAGCEATVFFPGITAERHPRAVAAVLEAGHELALHGHSHRRLDEMCAYEERADLEAGLRAFDAIAGLVPAGYRAPAWELTPVTLELLVEHGFAYDSSLMGDDRPYMLEAAGGHMLELPVHWSLDDAPHFASGGAPDALLAVLLAELDAAIAGDRLLTVTFHPEILGRPSRAPMLRSLLEAAAARRCPVVPLRRCAGV